jgi:hypothetical protein
MKFSGPFKPTYTNV